MADMDLALKVLRLLAEYEQTSDVWWRTDGEYAPVTFLVNCNDLFWWATADAEKVTQENFPIYEQCFKDLKAAYEYGEIYAHVLFPCRVRGMRPQNCCYKDFPKEIWPLLDACGPERPVDFANPWSRERVEKELTAEKENH